jgi:hypothetical protein
MATHLEDAQRLSNAPYQLGWLIRPLWPPQTWQVLRRSARIDHFRLLKVTHTKNTICRDLPAGKSETGDIIHAEGVRGEFTSSWRADL